MLDCPPPIFKGNVTPYNQGCQIFLGPNTLKREKVPNDYNIYHFAVK
jgi:hypothetical protein